MTGTSKRIPLFLFLLTGAFLLLAAPVWADAPILWGMIGAGAPIVVAVPTRGIALAVVILIEALVFWRLFNVAFRRALWVSLALNLISAILGLITGMLAFVAAFDILTGFVILALVVWWVYERRNIPDWASVTILATIVVGSSMAYWATLAYDPEPSTAVRYSGYLLPLFIGFGLSLFFEGVAGRFFVKRDNLWRVILAANVASYIFLAILWLFSSPPEVPMGIVQRADWLSRAKVTLRTIGSAQIAYREAAKDRIYGSIEALQEAEEIAPDCTLDDMIDNYRLTWEVNNVSTVPTEQLPTGLFSTFTAIAWPRDTREGFLSTFAITEDQVVRVYDPSNENDLNAIHTWDPIL